MTLRSSFWRICGIGGLGAFLLQSIERYSFLDAAVFIALTDLISF